MGRRSRAGDRALIGCRQRVGYPLPGTDGTLVCQVADSNEKRHDLSGSADQTIRRSRRFTAEPSAANAVSVVVGAAPLALALALARQAAAGTSSAAATSAAAHAPNAGLLLAP